MMRGIADLRGNVRNTGATTFFSTGSVIPQTTIAGTVFDWVSGSPAAGALIESFVPPDTLHPYVALADSNGGFAIQHVPPGAYTVRAYLDRNKNLSVDPSEPWDSVLVTLTDSVRSSLVIFTHDTVAPRISDVRAVDSVTLQVSFDKPVDPTQTLSAVNFAVVGPDSLPVPIVRATAAVKDTIPAITPSGALNPAGAANPTRTANPTRAGNPPAGGRSPARTVPGNARRDTLAVPRPVMPRALPISEATIVLGRPLTPKLVYRVRSKGIRGLLGRVGDSDRPYTAPAPPPPSTTPVGAPKSARDSTLPAAKPPAR
jgi:hypothetical protein